jgi:hypothetical protein
LGRETLPIFFGIKKSRNYGKTKLELLKRGGFRWVFFFFSQNANAVVTVDMHVSVYIYICTAKAVLRFLKSKDNEFGKE